MEGSHDLDDVMSTAINCSRLFLTCYEQMKDPSTRSLLDQSADEIGKLLADKSVSYSPWVPWLMGYKEGVVGPNPRIRDGEELRASAIQELRNIIDHLSRFSTAIAMRRSKLSSSDIADLRIELEAVGKAIDVLHGLCGDSKCSQSEESNIKAWMLAAIIQALSVKRS